ncbi:nitroreductase family deazaflavin-dependent oxidoreductase [Georgenia sunbinii]|uniref:nitroreductase family deazaflavin-dependent oxidoreductase n=1 Tax=Georgenia sunbinii TaxID=3117728 RepID=UPI002F268003
MRRIPRHLARAPIWLYRAGLGGLLGRRMVMLDHRGRRSGQVRHVVLETVAERGDGVVVVSGYGWDSQWLRNVQADPRVRLWRGWQRPRPATAHILDPAQTVDVLEDYRRRHPAAACLLVATLGLPALADDAPVPPDVADSLPAVLVRARRLQGSSPKSHQCP